MHAKRLVDASTDDLLSFIHSEPPESDSLELKQTLPAKSGDDPWVRGDDHVGDRARNELVEEVCAFANAHGGLLLVGVKESPDHPKRAAGVTPVPRCAELAVRLRLQFRDCIEPPLPAIEVEGIVTDSSGSGVV